MTTNDKAGKKHNDSWVYTDIVKDHFFNPRNVLIDAENYVADGVGVVGSPACGDMMQVWIKVDPETKRICEFKWRTFGCASAIASTSVLSEMVTENGGLFVGEAYSIKVKDILARLEGLPDHKMHCSVLGDRALRAAIDDYLQKVK